MRIGKTLYLDHHATTPLDPRVATAMRPYWRDEFANPHSADHAMGWAAAEAVEAAASKVGQLIGADGDEIVFTSGATEANNLALLGLARRAIGASRRRIVLSAVEHSCVIEIARVLRDHWGYSIDVLDVDEKGFVRHEDIDRLLGSDVLIVSVVLANHEIGTIQDVSGLAAAVRSVGAFLHCDAAQAPCAMDLQSVAEHVDLLSLSAHKMYGPKGIGALFIRRDLQSRIEPVIYGSGQQRGMRSGTLPVALCVGLGAAAELLVTENAEAERNELRRRSERFVEQLRQLPWPVHLNGPTGSRRHPGNVNVRFEGFAAQDVLLALQPHLAASSGSACTSGTEEPSHVLRAIGLSNDEARASIRFGLGRDTTDADVDVAVALIEGVLSRLSAGRVTS